MSSNGARIGRRRRYLPGVAAPPHLSPFVDYDDAPVDDDDADASDADELDGAAVAPPAPAPAVASGAAAAAASVDVERPESSASEKHEMAKSMMSKKAKRLYGRMQHGRQQKQKAADRLRQRRVLLAKRASSKGS